MASCLEMELGCEKFISAHVSDLLSMAQMLAVGFCTATVGDGPASITE